jgi:hypothetical protein
VEDFMAEEFIRRLSRPGGGLVMCCICFHYRTVDELFVDAHGVTWDVCSTGTCALESGLA